MSLDALVPISRRRMMTCLAGAALLSISGTSLAASLPKMTVHKSATCACCGAWVDHVRKAGFPVEVADGELVGEVKAKLKIPNDLVACHTAEVGGYVVEGHVPASAIKRLLAERPEARGLAVPGMPIGSPGMESLGMTPEDYDVILFGPSGRRTFARYRGSKELR